MHELGVVFYVVKDVKKVAEENHVEKGFFRDTGDWGSVRNTT